jgi:hypothetical protein
MDLRYFPHFIRKNFPEVPGTNEQFIEIGKEFKDYLIEIFKGKEDKLESIWDISPMNVIMNENHPLRVNGYDPVLLIHWDLFIQKMKEES